MGQKRAIPAFLCAIILLAARSFAASEDAVEKPAETPPTQGESKPKTPEGKRLAEFLELTFDRSPASILQAQTALAIPPATAPKPTEQLRLHVVAGRWEGVGAFLKAQPDADAPKIYEQVLRGLDHVAQTDAMEQQRQRDGGPVPMPTLLQTDIPELADIAPKDLTDDQLTLLGALLARALEGNAFLDPLLARLEHGTAQLGGTEPRKREQAAQLLLNANRDLDAARFLPPLETGRETASFPLLEKHVRCLFTKGRTDAGKDLIARAWQLNQLMVVSDAGAR